MLKCAFICCENESEINTGETLRQFFDSRTAVRKILSGPSPTLKELTGNMAKMSAPTVNYRGRIYMAYPLTTQDLFATPPCSLTYVYRRISKSSAKEFVPLVIVVRKKIQINKMRRVLRIHSSCIPICSNFYLYPLQINNKNFKTPERRRHGRRRRKYQHINGHGISRHR